ncbi:hypothetical protein KS4_36670 [Poriferisphaera corsica]|uniref:PEP-CTERM protein-sorting domain-containing protein n=1 Tax=Poriferisphaera corsica TaxID=2528020 RepID=A0A517YZE4_9BACT|nr:hypothetical protein [Poriferisphaera corsica]QDU35584.1 hypothetical protein KS4_36670 [Poriferisphaera corsica]
MKIFFISAAISMMGTGIVIGAEYSNDFSGISTTSYTSNPDLNSFSNRFDSWGVYGSGEGSSRLTDETATGGSEGVVDAAVEGQFFGLVDTYNPEHKADVSITFEINLDRAEYYQVSIDMGAYGLFEDTDSDHILWTYRFGNGEEKVIFNLKPSTEHTVQYQFASGSVVESDRPLVFKQADVYHNTSLSNGLSTYRSNFDGEEGTLYITMKGRIDGSKEAYVFDNLKVASFIPEPGSFLLILVGLLGVSKRD